MTGENITKGLAAGFAATIVLSPLMVVKKMAGLVTELDVFVAAAQFMGGWAPSVVWIAHFAIGTLAWGGLFAVLDPYLPGDRYWVRGIVFGVGAWLLLMTFVMPVAGVGLFGMQIGWLAPVVTLGTHVVFGAVLGGVYGAQRPRGAFELDGPVHSSRHVRPQRPQTPYP